MKLDDAMRAELLYRQEQFLEEAHLDPVGFGNRYGISTKNMQRVLDRKPIPKSVLENICSILGVPFSALRTPPDQEKGYQHFLQTVMELSLSPMTMEQRKERMKQEQQRMGASQSLWNRYSVWAEYEMELAKKLLSPTDSLEYQMAGLIDEIEDIETQFGLPGSHKKDMSDFVMLDYIYRAAADRHSPRTFILFTGDGHFAPAVRHLVQDLRKNVVLYGIRGSVSNFLKDAASECREFPDEEAQMRIYWQLIVDYFDEMTERRPNALLTFLRVANDVAAKHNLPMQNVEDAFSEMVRNGWFTQKMHSFPNHQSIRIVVPEWDKLIDAGLYQVK